MADTDCMVAVAGSTAPSTSASQVSTALDSDDDTTRGRECPAPKRLRMQVDVEDVEYIERVFEDRLPVDRTKRRKSKSRKEDHVVLTREEAARGRAHSHNLLPPCVYDDAPDYTAHLEEARRIG